MSKRKKFILFSFTLIAGILVATTFITSGTEKADKSDTHSATLSSTTIDLTKLPGDGGEKYNRLIFEKSPYLLQHATNPVDWYPWSDEAFAKAKKEDKPIFLSIGYSTCHWCHVMERESFEDPEVARVMNETFVSIKVDREERPDIDNVYMSVCQMMTGSGGWPLTIIMTPDKKPFFAGTYLPRESRYGRIGMLELIARVHDLWQNKRQELLQSAEQISSTLQQVTNNSSQAELDASVAEQAYQQLAQRFDAKQGGFSDAPKFPSPHNLLFLLRYWKRSGNPKALAMVEKTLTQMRLGGIYDHIGFGFHRYSTDAQWLLPHFEKMLYDQAMLAMAYLEAFQATGNKLFEQTAREIFTYVLRDMTSPEGGFYSAEDADSEGQEGKFYLWSTEEIREILGKEDAQLFIRIYNLQPAGNFLQQASHQRTGENIPHLRKPPGELAAELAMSETELAHRLQEIRSRLFAVREKRVHPHKDDKILTDWNGLMIAALALGARILDDDRYEQAAVRASEFILNKMRTRDGRLLHRYRDGQAALAAYVDDYAFFTWALIELYETTFDPHYLRTALSLSTDMIDHFWDDRNGGFFFTADDGEGLLVRQKEIYDGAIPSGNSVAAYNLVRLAWMTGNVELERKAGQILQAFSAKVHQIPSAHNQLMVALDFLLGPSFEVVIVGRSGAGDTRKMLTALRRQYLPNTVVLFVPSELEKPEIHELADFTKYQISPDGKATAFICQNFACNAPTTSSEEMLKLLQAF